MQARNLFWRMALCAMLSQGLTMAGCGRDADLASGPDG